MSSSSSDGGRLPRPAVPLTPFLMPLGVGLAWPFIFWSLALRGLSSSLDMCYGASGASSSLEENSSKKIGGGEMDWVAKTIVGQQPVDVFPSLISLSGWVGAHGEGVSNDFLHLLESGLLLLGPTWASFIIMSSRLLGWLFGFLAESMQVWTAASVFWCYHCLTW
jgi:hypothetical protein